MKNLLAALVIGLTLVTASMDADAARRFGGGSSFGRSAPALSSPAPKPSANPAFGSQQRQQQANRANAANPAAAAKPASPWRGMLMGAAAALGIGALMSALGLGEGFTQIIMMILLAMAAFFVFRLVAGMLMNKRMGTSGAGAAMHHPQSQRREENIFRSEPVQQSQTQQQAPAMHQAAMPAAAGSVMDAFANGEESEQPALTIPAGFDVVGFEKVARENFVKMQKAWDTGNVLEISDFTTNDLFVTVTHQLRERGSAAQTSEVIDLTAKLEGIASDEKEHVAVVDFDGAMKISGEFEEVHERWILVRQADDSTGWLLAGISQKE